LKTEIPVLNILSAKKIASLAVRSIHEFSVPDLSFPALGLK
jgi:hypothetical protein